MGDNTIKPPADPRLTAPPSQPGEPPPNSTATADRLGDKFNPSPDQNAARSVPPGHAPRGGGAQGMGAIGRGHRRDDTPDAPPDARRYEHTQQVAQRKDFIAQQLRTLNPQPAPTPDAAPRPSTTTNAQNAHRNLPPQTNTAQTNTPQSNTVAHNLADRFNPSPDGRNQIPTPEARTTISAPRVSNPTVAPGVTISAGVSVSSTVRRDASSASVSVQASAQSSATIQPGTTASLNAAASSNVTTRHSAPTSSQTPQTQTHPSTSTTHTNSFVSANVSTRAEHPSASAGATFQGQASARVNLPHAAAGSITPDVSDRRPSAASSASVNFSASSRAAFDTASPRAAASLSFSAQASTSINNANFVEAHAALSSTLNALNHATTPAELRSAAQQSLLLVAELMRSIGGDGKLIHKLPLLSNLDARVTLNASTAADADVAIAFAQQALLNAQAQIALGTAANASVVIGNRQQPIHDLTIELVNALLLTAHFGKLEKQGGSVVRQAEAALVQLLAVLGVSSPRQQSERGAQHLTFNPDYATAPPASPRPILTATELIHDLRSGAFLSPQDARATFMLTGRARVASEMMELMRLLDQVDELQRQINEAKVAPNGADLADDVLGSMLASASLGEATLDEAALGEALKQASLLLLPGRSAHAELPNILEALAGGDRTLRDKQHNPLLVMQDGTPLKLDSLVWHSAFGGLFTSLPPALDFPTQLSPLLLYGFQVLYSLIGFDGRTLAPRGFLLVQMEFNEQATASRFGCAAYSESWLRALIERLKDAASPQHNSFGEQLEESLAGGNFYQALLRGSVEHGNLTANSLTLAPLLRSAAPAFA